MIELLYQKHTGNIMNNKKLVIGILAHVDAGKTTLSESMLYYSGSIRKLGRVDHKDAFLDTYELERARGITIFSKQAVFLLEDMEVTLLDTPGHVDFSAEMERTLQVLDYAILIINGADGVQGHTLTLWKLLKRYQIPVFLFINKMDQVGTDRDKLLEEVMKNLDEQCLSFDKNQNPETFLENLAMCDESLMEQYLYNGKISDKEIANAVKDRTIFPCYFGSALKLTGVEDLISGLINYTKNPVYMEEFGAKVFKITRDSKGARLTHMKITGGTLTVKEYLSDPQGTGEECLEEKIDQIRIYSGDKYQTPSKVYAGTVCAVTGLIKTYSGQGFGIEAASKLPVLRPVLTYQVLPSTGADIHGMLKKLRQLEEEEPQLNIVWNEQLNEIHAQVMGEVEIEILKSMIFERFQLTVEFGSGSLVYKETILEPVVGVGHFEPLRHYAEVHLLLEPGERGSGLVFETSCSEEVLERNWQRLILAHLKEKNHRGVLAGFDITDMKITLIAGRAHIKHTEGGDFRQATYRALRHGLKKAESILLEPVYDFRLEVPAGMAGRALSDIQRMQGCSSISDVAGETAVITGSVPVVAMQNYQKEVTAYSRGHGRLFCTLKGYEPCHNAEEIIETRGYDSEKDPDHPTGSIFCSHGAGFPVGWEDVEKYMHVENGFTHVKDTQVITKEVKAPSRTKTVSYSAKEEKELEEIFVRTYGTAKQTHTLFKKSKENVRIADTEQPYGKQEERENKESYLLVDGYNIIFAWEELAKLAKTNLDAARYRLMDILCNYQGYKRDVLILVFDAYKVDGNPGTVMKYKNIHVVYTKTAETADQYIEKVVHDIGKKHDVSVATSDALEQMIIWGYGARRISAQGLWEEIESVNNEIRVRYLEKKKGSKNYPFQDFSSGFNEH